MKHSLLSIFLISLVLSCGSQFRHQESALKEVYTENQEGVTLFWMNGSSLFWAKCTRKPYLRRNCQENVKSVEAAKVWENYDAFLGNRNNDEQRTEEIEALKAQIALLEQRLKTDPENATLKSQLALRNQELEKLLKEQQEGTEIQVALGKLKDTIHDEIVFDSRLLDERVSRLSEALLFIAETSRGAETSSLKFSDFPKFGATVKIRMQKSLQAPPGKRYIQKGKHVSYYSYTDGPICEHSGSIIAGDVWTLESASESGRTAEGKTSLEKETVAFNCFEFFLDSEREDYYVRPVSLRQIYELLFPWKAQITIEKI